MFRDFATLGGWSPGPVVATIGFFDGLHLGHQHLLDCLSAAVGERAARSLVITFSNSPRAFHQPGSVLRYLTMPEEKLQLLAASGVDATLMIEYNESVAIQTAAMFLKGISHFVELAGLCAGYDTTIGSDMVGGKEGLEQLTGKLGIDLIFVEPFLADGRPVKSSQARRLVRAGEVERARVVMGHPYFAISKVRRGKGKGAKRLGIPTANLYLPWQKLTPKAGVYAALGEVLGESYPAAVCVMSDEQARRTVLEREETGGESGTRMQRNNHDVWKGSATPLDGRGHRLLPHTELGGAARCGGVHTVMEAHIIGYSGETARSGRPEPLYDLPLKLSFVARLRDWIDFDTQGALQEQMLQDIAETERIIAKESGERSPERGVGTPGSGLVIQDWEGGRS
ncbi:hypothetical protein IIA79_06705 [bacterium]|nr:hypothetical protein [bacterium]